MAIGGSVTAPAPLAARKLGDALRRAGEDRSRVTFPSSLFKGRILDFARDVLGIRSLASHQVDILEEYQRNESASILVCTGQKLGKTECMIVAAAYDFATEREVQVWIYAPKVDHTNAVFWPRFAPAMLAAYLPCKACRPAHEAWCALVDIDPLDEAPRPERCPRCSPLIPSELRDLKRPEKGRVSEWLNPADAEAGLRAPDKRSVRAYTGRKEGSKGGFSGKLRLLADECSDISDLDRETWAGNLVGGGKLMGFGNLLHAHGWFARAMTHGTTERARWSIIVQKSSRLSPNCRGRITWSDGVVTENYSDERPIRGMATPEGVEKNLKAWKGTTLIEARIDATAPKVIDGQLAPADRVAEAEARWSPNATGLLQIGVDVARARDKLAICDRRGTTMLELFAEALHEDDHRRGVELVIEHGKRHRKPHECKPRLVYDASGLEGAAFTKELKAQRAEEHFDIYPVQMSHPPRNRKLYDKRRDEMAHQFAEKLRTIAILADPELEGEIAATTGERVQVSYGSSGQKWEVLRVIDNDALRKLIGRSPDKRNACELAFLDVDGTEAAEESPADQSEERAPEQQAQPHHAPVTVPPRRSDDFVFSFAEEEISIFDRHALASAQLRGRA